MLMSSTLVTMPSFMCVTLAIRISHLLKRNSCCGIASLDIMICPKFSVCFVCQPQSSIVSGRFGLPGIFFEGTSSVSFWILSPSSCLGACCLAKMAWLSSKTHLPHLGNSDATVKALSHGQILPGSHVSIDQYISGVPGHLPHTQGKKPATSQFHGSTLFINLASSFVFIKHQVSLSSGEIIVGKSQSEQYALPFGILITGYHANYAPFSG